jgi:hypothetical protein
MVRFKYDDPGDTIYFCEKVYMIHLNIESDFIDL